MKTELKNAFHKALNRALLAAPVVGMAVASTARAEGDITSSLSSAATTAITAVLAVVGTILTAGMAIPVAKKVYRIVKSAFSAA